MILWRISNYADLLGIGAMEASARWHTAGKPVVYLAESPSSALLETIVHLEVDEEHRPDSYQLLKVRADDRISTREISLGDLPRNWNTDEQITQPIGDAWHSETASALLRIPSAITPETWNWMLNPRHHEANKMAIVAKGKYPYDWRLFRN
jgi:RES domain-containing protein